MLLVVMWKVWVVQVQFKVWEKVEWLIINLNKTTLNMKPFSRNFFKPKISDAS